MEGDSFSTLTFNQVILRKYLLLGDIIKVNGADGPYEDMIRDIWLDVATNKKRTYLERWEKATSIVEKGERRKEMKQILSDMLHNNGIFWKKLNPLLATFIIEGGGTLLDEETYGEEEEE